MGFEMFLNLKPGSSEEKREEGRWRVHWDCAYVLGTGNGLLNVYILMQGVLEQMLRLGNHNGYYHRYLVSAITVLMWCRQACLEQA